MLIVKLCEKNKPCKLCSGEKSEILRCKGNGKYYLNNSDEYPIQQGLFRKLKKSHHIYFWYTYFSGHSITGFCLDNEALKIVQEEGYSIEVDKKLTQGATYEPKFQQLSLKERCLRSEHYL